MTTPPCSSHTVSDVLERFDAYQSRLLASAGNDPAALRYVVRHRRRMRELAGLVAPLAPPSGRLCDVGVGHYSFVWPEVFPQLQVVLADCSRHAAQSATAHGLTFVQVDLETDRLAQRLPEPVDLLIFTEVLEHLQAPPREILADLAACLAPGGHLVLSTPNFLSVGAWGRLLRGRNPAAWPERRGPDPNRHVREYTMRELRSLVPAGLKCRTTRFSDCWDTERRAAVRILGRLFPSLRSNMLLVLRRPQS